MNSAQLLLGGILLVAVGFVVFTFLDARRNWPKPPESPVRPQRQAHPKVDT